MTGKTKYFCVALLTAGLVTAAWSGLSAAREKAPLVAGFGVVTIPEKGSETAKPEFTEVPTTAAALRLPDSQAATTTAAALSQLKVGIVDLSRLFQEYYKTKEAEKKLNGDKSKAKKELDERGARYKELAARLAEIEKVLKDRLVNEQLKSQKQSEGEKLLVEARSMAEEIQQFSSRRERQLQDQWFRVRKGILSDITDRLREKAKRDNYDLVFDKSGLGMSGTPLLPVSRDAWDFTSEVILELNRNAPATEPPAGSDSK